MKTMYIFSRLLCLLIIFSNCSKNDQEKFEPGMLKGKVTDAETGLPIVSATIIIGSSVKIVHTDGNGEYTASIDGGEYIITARKEGYLDATSNAKVDGSTEVVNFQLQDKPLNPGQAKVKGQLDGLDLSTWNASCKYIGDTLKITASATYQSGSGILRVC